MRLSRHLGFALEGAETRPGGAIKFRVGGFCRQTHSTFQSDQGAQTRPQTPKPLLPIKGEGGASARVCSSRLPGSARADSKEHSRFYPFGRGCTDPHGVRPEQSKETERRKPAGRDDRSYSRQKERRR